MFGWKIIVLIVLQNGKKYTKLMKMTALAVMWVKYLQSFLLMLTCRFAPLSRPPPQIKCCISHFKSNTLHGTLEQWMAEGRFATFVIVVGGHGSSAPMFFTRIVDLALAKVRLSKNLQFNLNSVIIIIDDYIYWICSRRWCFIRSKATCAARSWL